MWGVVPCAERNGELSRYQVRYNPTSDPSDEKFATEFNNDLNNTIVFTVIGLIPRTEYTIEVIPVLYSYYFTGILSANLTVTTGLSQGSVV